MQFEQITLDELPFDSAPKFRYNRLDNDGLIYCKIDWLTVMFFDCSLNHVLSWLKLDGCVSDFCESRFEQCRGYDTVFKFIYNGVCLETSSFNYYGDDLSVNMFDVIVPKIRLELSGSALDYLRSIGVDMDTYRFTTPYLPDGGGYHFTRCDFAFDFVNYMPGFVDHLIDHCQSHALASGRVPLASTNGAIGFRILLGNQKTVYLGSPQSDSMLRVYDKRLQSINPGTGIYVKDNPYDNPDSWYRIEWQTRNKTAHNHVLDRNLEFKHILKLIFDRYAFADGTMDARNKARKPVDFWLSLFNWDDVEKRIVQNAKYVQYVTPVQRCLDTYDRNARNSMFGFSILGREESERRMNAYLRSLEGSDPVSIRRRQAFFMHLNELGIDVPIDPPDPHGLYCMCGRLFFKY